jgi:hypothetical protein
VSGDLVTISIPAWQSEGFIDRTLQCARNQTLTDLVIRVSIDLSEDATEEICREHARDDRRIEVISQTERLGWAGNANTLLDRVETDFGFLYFHDDIIDPRYSEVLVQALVKRPDAMSAHCDLERFGDLSGVLPAQSYEGSDTIRILTFLIGPETGTPLRSMIRRAVTDAGLRFPIIAGEGPWRAWPFTMRLVAAGPALAIPEVLYRRWHRPGSLTGSWLPPTLSRVIEGQRRQAEVSLAIIEAADATEGEKELMRYALYLNMITVTRRQEDRLGCHELVDPTVVSDAFAVISMPDEAGARDPEIGSWIRRAQAHLLFLEGRHEHRRDRLDGAARKLQTAVDLDPLNARALGNLALVRLKQGDTEEAGTLAERARALDPSLTFPGLSLDD